MMLRKKRGRGGFATDRAILEIPVEQLSMRQEELPISHNLYRTVMKLPLVYRL